MNDLVEIVLMKYFLPTKNAKLSNKITSFHQLEDKSCMMHGKDSKSYLRDVLIMVFIAVYN